MKDWELFGAVRLGELAARIAGPSRRAWTSASEGRLSATSAGRSQQYPKTEGEHDEKSRCEPTRGICRGKDRTPRPSSDGDQATAEEAKHVGFVLPSWWTSQATGIALVARSQETAVTDSRVTSLPSSIQNGSPTTGSPSRLGRFGTSWTPWASGRLAGGAARSQVRLAGFPSSTYRDGRRSRARTNLALSITATKELASRVCV